jgi:cell division protein FtsA
MDVLKILQKSTIKEINPNEELIGVEPIIFRVGDNETKEPVLKKGKSLYVKSFLITTDKRTIYDLIKVLEKCNISVVDITCNGLVEYYNFKNPLLEEQTGVIINLGDTSTSLNVISKGIFINNEVLDTGGNDIDKDIAYIYNLNKKNAKYLKEHLAVATGHTADPKETLTFINKDNKEITINQYEISEVVASRIKEILNLTKKTINHLTKKEISYIIITGGLTELKDFSVELSSIYGNIVQIGNISNIGARNNKYSVSIGMLKYFNEKLKLRNKEFSTVSEEDINILMNKDNKLIANDSILGKVFGYFFDN